MSQTTHSESKGLSTFAYIAAFLILFAILAVFGDMFTFVVGAIGLVITFAAFYKDDSHGDEHH
ncbi:hypothetical protein [Dyadobacter arcticus]|uniref:Membrane protein YqaA with SNARE-associated domain n=1 Tax=Dyadobacter arcticus TaxID=1078754 RepID=A0ABX0UFI5_9BACT|nr:hypothetical protein [Dyadobacter arcticus]NIJ51767.1 membrane protein YqaA with SNARE-associated domain [Dyadobacter arcticus]